jgi:hypothetical protein
MVRITTQNLIIPEADDPLDHVECHMFLPVKEAQDIARHLINMNSIFSYLPVPGADDEVEITLFDDDLDELVTIELTVKQ